MNKTERSMLFELYNLAGQVPNIRNNMDASAVTSQRWDLMEQSGYLNSLLYSFLQYAQPLEYFDGNQEDKDQFKEEFYVELSDFKEFIETRKKENWQQQTDYRYKYARGGW